MRKLIILFLIFNNIVSFGQKNTFSNWEKKILSNVSFEKIRYSIANDSLKVFYDKKYIPVGLIDTLKQWDKEFSFANPNEKYRSTDVVRDAKIPSRQIIIILKDQNNIFIAYKHGGFGFHHHILWAEIQDTKVNDIWIGVTFDDLNTIDKIENVLSENPDDLNTNMICF